MNKFDELLKTMEFDFFGTATHKITFDNMMQLLKEKKCILLDVRSKEEYACINFPFAKHIPLNEIPDRKSEIPKDKMIVAFCSSATRATMVYTYLLLQEYDAKILTDSLGEIAANFMPGYVLNKCEHITE